MNLDQAINEYRKDKAEQIEGEYLRYTRQLEEGYSLLRSLRLDFDLPERAYIHGFSPLTVSVLLAEDGEEFLVLLKNLARAFHSHFDREVLDAFGHPLIVYQMANGQVKLYPNRGSSCELVKEEATVTRYKLECK